MSEMNETREESLLRIIDQRNDSFAEWISDYQEKYYRINRRVTLSVYASKPKYIGLKSYFIDGDVQNLKQNFYVTSKLIMASELETTSGLNAFASYHPFLYGLLSDSAEIYDWLANAEIKGSDYVKSQQFRFHQYQFVLRQDDAALRETIALVAKKGGNKDKTQAAVGLDFFSLLLKRDKEALQTLIENTAKIKSADELVGQFLAGYAVILAKLCWFRGVEVGIKSPLVPMPLLPIKPLETYDVEYDFLRPGWIPPEPGMLDKLKRWFK